MILEARSPFFRGMLESNMAEANEGKYVIKDMLEPVARAVLHFIYAGGFVDGGGDDDVQGKQQGLGYRL
jgi:hypothetical protein